jgi:hypothetical protein
MGPGEPLPGVGTPKRPVTCDFAPPYESINRTDSVSSDKPSAIDSVIKVI